MMNKKAKKLISVLLLVCLALSNVSVFAAWDGYFEIEKDDGITTIVNMNYYSTIASSGAGATIDYTKSSQYAALWLPASTKIISFKQNIPTDWTDYKRIQFWMYSPKVRNTSFIFLIYCNNGSYFGYDDIIVDWEGWKFFDIPLSEISGSTGSSWEDIAYIAFNANGWGSFAEEGTELAIDNIVLRKPSSRLMGSMEEHYDEKTQENYIAYSNDIVALYDKSATVLKGGKSTRLDRENMYVKTKVIDGKTVVPYDFFNNYLDATTVTSDGAYIIKLDDKSVEFSVNNEIINLNGNEVKADVKPFESDGKLYVPVSQIASALGYYTEKVDGLTVFSKQENNTLQEQQLEEIVSYAASYYNSDEKDITECDFEKLAKNWREFYVGNETNDLSNEKVLERVNEISEKGKELLTTMQREPEVRNLWGSSDITATTSMSKLYGNIQSMALAYGTYGSSYYHDETMRDAILYALEWGYNNLYGDKEMAGVGWRDTGAYNWFDWRIGVPRYLLNTLLIMGDAIPDDLVQKYVTPVAHFGQKAVTVGSNRLNGSYVQAGVAIITKDARKLKEARDGMDDTVWYNDGGEGMQSDGSYVYHRRHPMNGAYGTEQVDMISPLICILNDTKFEVTGLLGKYVTEWFDIAYKPFFYNGSFMSMVAGRGTLTNDKSVGATVIQSYVRMLDLFDDEQKPLVESFIKSQLLASNAFYSNEPTIGEINTVTRIMSDDSIKPTQDYYMNKVYHNMDRVVQHSENYSAGVAMSSSRIYNYECINNQNNKGWYIGDGMLYVYTKDRTSFDPIFWTVSDPYKRPGTTVDTQKRQALQIITDYAYLSDEDFVGGVSDSEHGVSAMKLDTYSKYEMDGYEGSDHGVESPLHDCTLEAQKAWFLFDDEIVALGSAVNANDGFPVLTVLDNRQAENSMSGTGTDASAYQVKAVEASAEPQSDNPASHAVDGSTETRWSAEGEVYIDLDLGEVKPIGYVGIAIHKGDSRIQFLDIEVSQDGAKWDTVYEGQSSGKTTEIELYNIGAVNARYVRVSGHEADSSTWNSFTEICVYPQVEAAALDLKAANYITTDSIVVDSVPQNFTAGETKQFVGPKWMHTQNCGGWYFPTQQSVSIKTTNTSRVFVESWINHGVSPTDGSYAYIQLPNFTQEETVEYTNNPDVEILANTPELQVVREKTLGKTGMVFWKKGSFENITVNRPLIMIVEETMENIVLHVSDPTHKLKDATISLAGSGLSVIDADDGVTAETNDNLVEIKLSLEGSRGKTYSVTLEK